MSKHTKFLTSEDINIVLNLYNESCRYVLKRINTKSAQEQFIKTQKIVFDTIKNKFNEVDFLTSFYLTKTALNRTKDQMNRSYHFHSLLDNLFINKQKYDNMVFDIAFDILYKTKVRFFDGYVE